MFETIKKVFNTLFLNNQEDNINTAIIKANRLNYLDHSRVCAAIHWHMKSIKINEITITDPEAIEICKNTFNLPNEDVVDFLVSKGYFITVESGPIENTITLHLHDETSHVFEIFKLSSTIRNEKKRAAAANEMSIKRIVETQLAEQKEELLNLKRIYINYELFGNIDKSTVRAISNKVLLPYRLFCFDADDDKIGIGVL